MKYHDHGMIFTFYEPFLPHILVVTEPKYTLYYMANHIGNDWEKITTKYDAISREEREELYLGIR